jgi:hypothetical protein
MLSSEIRQVVLYREIDRKSSLSIIMIVVVPNWGHGNVSRGVLQVREMLNSRYDDLKSGRVKPISRDEVVTYFREKSAAARRTLPGS